MSLLGKLAMLTSTILWGASFFMMKNAMDEVSVFFLMFVRFIGAAIFLSIIFPMCFKKFNKATLISGAISGVFLFLAYIFQTYGLKYTTPGNNAFLTVVYCVIVPLFSWIWTKKRPNLITFIACGLCLAGIGCISIDGKGFNIGDILTLICSLFFALQIYYTSLKIEGKDVMLFTIIQFAIAGILSVIVWAIGDRSVPVFTWDLTKDLLYATICATGLAFFFQVFGQKYVAPESCGIILSLESVFAVIFSVIFFGERPSIQAYIGFVLVFIAVVMPELYPLIQKKINAKRRKKEQLLSGNATISTSQMPSTTLIDTDQNSTQAQEDYQDSFSSQEMEQQIANTITDDNSANNKKE